MTMSLLKIKRRSYDLCTYSRSTTLTWKEAWVMFGMSATCFCLSKQGRDSPFDKLPNRHEQLKGTSSLFSSICIQMGPSNAQASQLNIFLNLFYSLLFLGYALTLLRAAKTMSIPEIPLSPKSWLRTSHFITITTYPCSSLAHSCPLYSKSGDLQGTDSTTYTTYSLFYLHIPLCGAQITCLINSSTLSKNPEFSYSSPPPLHAWDQTWALDNLQQPDFVMYAAEDCQKKRNYTAVFTLFHYHSLKMDNGCCQIFTWKIALARAIQ